MSDNPSTLEPEKSILKSIVAESKDRDSQGRFIKGHPKSNNAGNPIHIKAIKRRLLLQDTITDDEFRKLIKKILASAMKGSFQHQKLLVEQLIGALKMEISTDDIRDAFREIVEEVSAEPPTVQ